MASNPVATIALSEETANLVNAMQATQVRMCIAFDCKNNQINHIPKEPGCILKRVEIGKAGQCLYYSPKDSE